MIRETSIPDVIAVVPAAGAGTRLGGAVPKPFREIGGKPIVLRTLEALAAAPSIEGIVLVLAPGAEGSAAEFALPGFPWFRTAPGGARRFDSVASGLRAVPHETTIVVVHDGARPFVTVREVEETIALARSEGAAIAVTSPVETVKRVDGDFVTATLDRERIRLAQTPQAFRARLLREAYDRALAEGWAATDESAIVERAGIRVAVVPADRWNVKITAAEDLPLAEWIAKEVRR